MKMIMIVLLINSMLFTMAQHPLTMGLHLIIQTIFTAMLINLIMKTTWFSFIVVIILLGGMLVLFIYMASIASNEKFMTSVKILPVMMMIVAIMMIMMFISPDIMYPVNMSSSMMNMNISILTKMFNTKNAMITIMMMLYLMFTMISINNIVKMTDGPLRKKN